MSERPSSPPTQSTTWQQRVHLAGLVGDRWTAAAEDTPADDEQAKRWLASIDPTTYVGSRHHTVPRFLLQKWSDQKDQVQTFRRIEGLHGLANITDLAIRDFYTVINDDGTKSSALESVMGLIEAQAKPYLNQMQNPLIRSIALSPEAIGAIAQFAAFQSTRTSRRRRELELQAEWYAKTMGSREVPDDELRRFKVVPHQNETASIAAQSASTLVPYFVCRPLAIMTLDRPRFYMCDEPVVLNTPHKSSHLPDCTLTDAEIAARWPTKSRTVHFTSTMPTGHGVADEILMALSPSTALLWGPLSDVPHAGSVERVALDVHESMRVAEMANAAMCAQALDWIISRTDDEAFVDRDFPPTGPLMRVCDGTSAAAASINDPPDRFRPHRLWAL